VSEAKREIATEAKEYASAALATLAEIMTDEEAPHSARVSASTAILDRGYGKPHQTQSVDNTHSVTNPLAELAKEIAAEGRRVTYGSK